MSGPTRLPGLPGKPRAIGAAHGRGIGVPRFLTPHGMMAPQGVLPVAIQLPPERESLSNRYVLEIFEVDQRQRALRRSRASSSC